MNSETVAIVIVDHGSRREESNRRLLEFVDLFRTETEHPIVEPAHMELASPSIDDAFQSCVGRGATKVIVSPFFLLPGRHWTKDIPELSAAAATKHGVEFVVTSPLGIHKKLVEVMQERIDFCLNSKDGEHCTNCGPDKPCRSAE